MDRNHLTIKTFMAITAERDAAIRERNMALEERKRAFAERDMAMLQRDAAIAERNAALQERDEAIASLRLRENSDDDDVITLPDSLVGELEIEAKNIHYPRGTRVSESSYGPRGEDSRDADYGVPEASERGKPRRGKHSREGKKRTKPNAKSPRGSKRMNNEQELGIEEDDLLEKEVSWKENNTGTNQIDFEESSMCVPVCSCTGSPQPCYRWGNGGWQSACCTTTISMYPLPQVANKRYSRVGGRKMSGGAFRKLLSRLGSEGFDFSTPLDLKSHWAKHGSNRYSTMK